MLQAHPLQAPRRRQVRAAALRVLAGGLGLGLGVLFVGLTLLTIAVWAADPDSAETNPVVDLGFFALGGLIIAVGFGSRLREPERHAAGIEQALVGLVALSTAGALAGRVEPFWLGLALVVLGLVTVVLHPARAELALRPGRVYPPLAALGLAAALPAAVYANDMLGLARAAGPSCFAGQCARGDRYAEMAALAAAIVLVTLLASARPAGWRLSTWSAGAAAVLVGVASMVLQDVTGSLGPAGGAAAAAWGLLVIVTGERHAGNAPRTARHGG